MSNHTLTHGELQALVARLNAARADGPREEWIRIGMAIHAADPSDVGYQLWEDFSCLSPKFDRAQS